MIPNEVIVGLSTAAVGIIAAVLGWRGKKQETSATSLTAMMSEQAQRIDKLWARLDTVERDLRETRRELAAEQEQSYSLRRLLQDAFDWLLEWSAWASSDRRHAPPQPDLRLIEEALERARNPPE
ncbi:hypothetical protein [Corynebacterium freneyi]|uniref:Coiled-coil protein SlyX n=1 Tax=Corynebacterium freneyi TaxID=134034 RepID=A0ABS4U8P4_9CORY|nr:hypothetical protein [Corynebacterium freneyi]MBP2333032.1 putative coiled-coil protein SlyX [Corynebacterium freneyi]QXA52870.1 hypothetical protein I6L56_00015 [Corynebacterium freneyi]WJZ04866.1 hypothetical protein CFREN_04440 [Corynebacterium freneyi]